MQLFREIKDHLRENWGSDNLVVGTDIEWGQAIGALDPEIVLIVYTNREIRSEGGDGISGIIREEHEAIHAAVEWAINEDGSTGRINRYVIRSNYHSIEDAKLNALFD